jgi:hypothetical protein
MNQFSKTVAIVGVAESGEDGNIPHKSRLPLTQ